MNKIFTKEEINVLKEIVKERISLNSVMDTEGMNYRNRFETWDDTYINLKNNGFTHKEIIERIGKKK